MNDEYARSAPKTPQEKADEAALQQAAEDRVRATDDGLFVNEGLNDLPPDQVSQSMASTWDIEEFHDIIQAEAETDPRRRDRQKRVARLRRAQEPADTDNTHYLTREEVKVGNPIRGDNIVMSPDRMHSNLSGTDEAGFDFNKQESHLLLGNQAQFSTPPESTAFKDHVINPRSKYASANMVTNYTPMTQRPLSLKATILKGVIGHALNLFRALDRARKEQEQTVHPTQHVNVKE